MALSGTLKDFGIADILQLIGHQTKTGKLTLKSAGDEVEVFFIEGNVVFAADKARKSNNLLGSLLLLGTAEWPRARFLPVAVTTSISGVGFTAYSEHLNTARGTWTYSDLMPVLPGTAIGLAPLAQWIVIPILAFAAARPVNLAGHLDLPIMGTVTPGDVARPGRRAS